jgi:hypothetical protein
MSVRRLLEDGSTDMLPNVGEANVGDVIRIEDDGTPEMGSWVWHELTAKEPMNTLNITEKSQAYAANYQGNEHVATTVNPNLIFGTMGDKRIMVYVTEEDKANDKRFVEFVVWLDDEANGVYGVIFNPLEDVRVYLRVMPTGKTALGMFGSQIDPTSGYLCDLCEVPSFVIDAVSARIKSKINNPSLML